MSSSSTFEMHIAAFSPEEHEFLQWWGENGTKQLSHQARQGGQAGIEFEKKHWGARYDAYLKWIKSWIDLTDKSCQDCFDLIKSADFSNRTSIRDLNRALDKGSHDTYRIANGVFNGRTYEFALRVDLEFLRPTVEMTEYEEERLERSEEDYTVGVCVMGIQDAEELGLHHADTPEHNGDSALQVDTSENNDKDYGDGFFFSQIGELCVIGPKDSEWWDMISADEECESEEDEDGDDSDDDGAKGKKPGNGNEQMVSKVTNFAVVVRLDCQGRQGAVYLIYNKSVPRGEDWDELDMEEREYVAESGREPGQFIEDHERGFTVAKIAERLDDLSPGKTFTVQATSGTRPRLFSAEYSETGFHRPVQPDSV